MDCEKIKEIIPRYIKHQANEEEIAGVEEHLCVCQLCRDYLSGILDKNIDIDKKEPSLQKEVKAKNISKIEILSLIVGLLVLFFFVFIFLTKR